MFDISRTQCALSVVKNIIYHKFNYNNNLSTSVSCLPCLYSVLQVSAKSFQELKLEYTMEREDPHDPDVFFMRKDTGLITLKERLAYVESQKQYRLNVTATEEKSGLKQTTQVWQA